MIIYYGYADGSGEYYIVVDSEKCNGCGECIKNCPQKALEITTMMVNLEEQQVARVKEEHRKKIQYTCAPCKPDQKTPPCISSCRQKAITYMWKKAEG